MKNANLREIAQNERERQSQYKRRILCCGSTACLSAGAGATITTMKQAVAACKCEEHEAEVVQTGCMGLCSRGPLVRIESKEESPVLYGDISPDIAQQIVAKYLPMDGIDSSDIDEATNEPLT